MKIMFDGSHMRSLFVENVQIRVIKLVSTRKLSLNLISELTICSPSPYRLITFHSPYSLVASTRF